MTIKKEFLQTVVAFGGNGFCLGKRSEADLIDLAIMGYNDKSLHRFFESVPSLPELKKRKMALIEQQIKDEFNQWRSEKQIKQ